MNNQSKETEIKDNILAMCNMIHNVETLMKIFCYTVYAYRNHPIVDNEKEAFHNELCNNQ